MNCTKHKFCRESLGVWVRSIDESYPYFGTTDGKEKDKDERQQMEAKSAEPIQIGLE